MDWIWHLFSDLLADRFSFFLLGGKERESKDDGCFGTDEEQGVTGNSDFVFYGDDSVPLLGMLENAGNMRVATDG